MFNTKFWSINCNLNYDRFKYKLVNNKDNLFQTLFVVDEVSNIIKDSVEHSIGSQLYNQNMVNKWTDSVVENCLTSLCKLAKPFKYIGKYVIILSPLLCNT